MIPFGSDTEAIGFLIDDRSYAWKLKLDIGYLGHDINGFYVIITSFHKTN